MGLLSRTLRLLGSKRAARAGNAIAAGNGGAPEQPETGDARAAKLYEDAMRYLERDDAAAARPLLERCIELRHDFADAHWALGQIHQRQGRLDDATDCYVLAAHFRPDLGAAHLQLGLIAMDTGCHAEAAEHLERAVASGSNAKAHGALGAALLKLGRVDDSVAQLRRAIELDPNLAEAHNNLGYVLFREFEQYELGARHVERAVALAPTHEGVLCTWTMVLQQQGRFEELLRLSDHLLAVSPGLHEVRLNRGLVRLTLGEFREGWRDYEARKFLAPYAQGPRRYPEWEGEPLAGKRLFVYSEQGIGDEIMFASCLPEVLSAAQQCVVECSPKLESLFRRSFPSARVLASSGRGVVAGGEVPASDIDLLAPIGSLPRFLRNSLAEFPMHRGYLVPDPGHVVQWKTRLDALGPGMKVGIAWRGGLQSTRRGLRSIPLVEWLPLLCCDGASFISLQHTAAEGEVSDLRSRHGVTVHHWQDALDDFDQTAALVGALDLVITVQTAVAHLAGGLGKRGWVMLSNVPEWRYTASGETMPWYPSLHLFRQPAPGDWGTVMSAVASALGEAAGRLRHHVT